MLKRNNKKKLISHANPVREEIALKLKFNESSHWHIQKKAREGNWRGLEKAGQAQICFLCRQKIVEKLLLSHQKKKKKKEENCENMKSYFLAAFKKRKKGKIEPFTRF